LEKPFCKPKDSNTSGYGMMKNKVYRTQEDVDERYFPVDFEQ